VQYIKIFRTSSSALRWLARRQQEAHLAGMAPPREQVVEVGTEEEEEEEEEEAAGAVIRSRRRRFAGAAAETDIRIRRTASG
jgi:hypothetical protein